MITWLYLMLDVFIYTFSACVGGCWLSVCSAGVWQQLLGI